jgi:uncharacterized short protein YbdD (DUF466 family)
MATTQLQIRETPRHANTGSTVLITRWRHAKKLVRRLWRGLRDWCGDSAYDRYLIATQKKDLPACAPLTEKQFYVEQLNRRYSRPSRCC